MASAPLSTSRSSMAATTNLVTAYTIPDAPRPGPDRILNTSDDAGSVDL
jgi:hypothetical protein